MRIEPYERYKESGVEWLGEVPEGWGIKRLKDLTKILTCGVASTPEYVSEENGVPFLSAQNVRPNQLDLSKYRCISKELHKQLTKYRRPLKDDVLVTRVGAGIGDACIVDIDLEFSIYVSLTHIRTSNEIIPRFLVYFFGTNYLSILNKAGTPDGGGQGNLNVKNVNRFLIAIPSISKQKSIADYLDTKTNQIDQEVNLLTKKSEQYVKLKQSLINETVTQGLDKAVVMKGSGIEWISDIPEHWGVKRTKEISTINKSSLSEKTQLDYEFEYIDIGSVTYGIKGYSTERMTFKDSPSRAKRIVEKGDTIISTVRTYLKAIASISEDVQDIIVSTGFAVISPKRQLNEKYCSYLLTSEFIIDEISAKSKGVSYPAITATEIGDLLFLMPPIEEQKMISIYLDKKTNKIDTITKTINNKINKLKELRKTLINDVVTGKIKVVS